MLRAVAAADEVARHLQRVEADYRRTKNARALPRALGFTTGVRREKYDGRQLVEEYVALTDRGVDRVSAIEHLALKFGFPSAPACRTKLLRTRNELRLRFCIPAPDKFWRNSKRTSARGE